MGAAKKIEDPVRNFSQQELDELTARLEELGSLPIDIIHLKMSPHTGRLDDRIRRSLADHPARNTREI